MLDVPSPTTRVLTAIACLCACRAREASVAPGPAATTRIASRSDPGTAGSPAELDVNPTFAYLLERYDADGDGVVTAAEYTRRNGQLERWDTDGDGRLTVSDWGADDPLIDPQILDLQERWLLGRAFQAEGERTEVLSLDELAAAFHEYDGADGSEPDEELGEAEFRARFDECAASLPGEGSMMIQSFAGGLDEWSELCSFFDFDRSGSLSLEELASYFEEHDLYELRFDRESYDAGVALVGSEPLDYRAGLPVGSPIPDLTLAALHGDEPVSLARLTGERPIALIFGSYT